VWLCGCTPLLPSASGWEQLAKQGLKALTCSSSCQRAHPASKPQPRPASDRSIVHSKTQCNARLQLTRKLTYYRIKPSRRYADPSLIRRPTYQLLVLKHIATDTYTHDTEYQDANLGFDKRSQCYWKDAVVARTPKGVKGLHILGCSCRTVVQRMTPCMSTAIIMAAERCFSQSVRMIRSLDYLCL
jgi:hypothetical protein